jgi:UDP:flavonoid glycosyltransferase YjiC (YdhE family)
LSPDASSAELRAAIDDMLADQAVRSRTKQLAKSMLRYRGAEDAIDTIQEFAGARR